MIEIAKIFNVEYEPDPQVMQEEPRPLGLDGMLIDLQDKNNLGGNGGASQPLGFKDFPLPPALPVMPNQHVKPFDYGPSNVPSGSSFTYNIPPYYPNLDNEKNDANAHFLAVSRVDGRNVTCKYIECVENGFTITIG